MRIPMLFTKSGVWIDPSTQAKDDQTHQKVTMATSRPGSRSPMPSHAFCLLLCVFLLDPLWKPYTARGIYSVDRLIG